MTLPRNNRTALCALRCCRPRGFSRGRNRRQSGLAPNRLSRQGRLAPRVARTFTSARYRRRAPLLADRFLAPALPDGRARRRALLGAVAVKVERQADVRRAAEAVSRDQRDAGARLAET